MARRGWWRIRCHATSKRTGLPCRHWAIEGGYVCWNHGGAIGQVRLAARRRLAAAKADRRMQRTLGRGLNAAELSWITGDSTEWRREVSTLLAELKAELG